MIIDHDESKRTGRVVTLAQKVQNAPAGQSISDAVRDAEKPVEKTLTFAAIKPVAPTRGSVAKWGDGEDDFREDIARSEVLEYRPRYEPARETVTGRFVPAGPCAGLTLYGKRKGLEQNEREPEGVVQEKTPADTGTHALPAVEKMTGKPSGSMDLHRTAARIQRAMEHLGVAVWYGEYTKEFWVMDWTGLHPFKDVTSLYRGMGWQHL